MLPVHEDIYSAEIDVSLAAVNRAVEECIAVEPAQYLWSYRRFKKQPEGYPPFYDFR
jgi:KDO2-lipid IV(A) lauroyltransferase